VYLRSPESFTVSVGMATLEGIYVHEPLHSVAMALIALVPPIIVFFIAQRFLVGGVGRIGWRG
jgi:multiple sugar transport system permease protein